MVLHHVAQGAGAVVELSAALDAESFRHRDLHAFDKLAIPQRLEKGICETEEEQILHCAFAQVVIDAKFSFFAENALHHGVYLPRGGEIASERLFDDDARAFGTTQLAKLAND